ncbi:MAG: lytic transglycosylase domain-containing protein [Alphaproteobacteria bacterium]
MHRRTGMVAGVLCLMVGLTPVTPAKGYIDAQRAYEMALNHHYPTDGRVRNYRIAMLLYCRADTDGHADSAYAIGLLFAGGHGFKQNQARAHAWFKRAAALGHPEAGKMAAIFKPRGERSSARCPNGWGRSARAKLYAPKDIRAMVNAMAPEFKLDPKLVLAVIQVESAYQANAISSANAQGLMQLIPATAERFGVRDAFNPKDNIRGGMSYLRWLLKHFKGDVTKAVAAYNAGEGVVRKYGGIPPYRETRNYVRKIRRLYTRLRHPI